MIVNHRRELSVKPMYDAYGDLSRSQNIYVLNCFIVLPESGKICENMNFIALNEAVYAYFLDTPYIKLNILLQYILYNIYYVMVNFMC